MKLRWIYSEQSNSVEDMSKDRVHLNLSYNEWVKIRELISNASGANIADDKELTKLSKKAENLRKMIDLRQELEPIWLDKEGRAK